MAVNVCMQNLDQMLTSETIEAICQSFRINKQILQTIGDTQEWCDCYHRWIIEAMTILGDDTTDGFCIGQQ